MEEEEESGALRDQGCRAGPAFLLFFPYARRSLLIDLDPDPRILPRSFGKKKPGNLRMGLDSLYFSGHPTVLV
jgi:hypothetical protein